MLRDAPGALGEEDQDGGEGDPSLKLLNNTFSVEERIDLLTRTFTQELFKKIQMAIFEGDRKLITYMLVLRVLQAENFIDRGLYDFLIGGAQVIPSGAQAPADTSATPWLTDEMWADLRCLSTLKPFSAQNLLNHITNHPDRWAKYYSKRDRAITFQDLPNKDLLDLRFFTQLDADELSEGTGQGHRDGPS